MSRFAPDTPTTPALYAAYANDFTEAATDRIAQERQTVSGIMGGRDDRYLAVIGPCALTDTVVIESEGDALRQLNDSNQGVYALHRLPPWKPRTRAEDWHGLETTAPEAAFQRIVSRALAAANVSMEFGHPEHAARYGQFVTFGWIGGRHVGNTELIRHLAVHKSTRDMPLAIKNGLDGTADEALKQIAMVNELRGPEGAPAILLYRGGSVADSPLAWEQQYKKVWEQTEGRLIVDKAHGTEMAHHVDGVFEKSVDGELLAQAHYQELVAEGYGALGSMYEASQAESPTDPVMPFALAVSGVRLTATLRSKLLVPVR